MAALPESRNHVDLMCLVLAMKEFKALGGDKKHLEAGVKLVKKFPDVFKAMVDNLIEPLVEKNLPGLTTLGTDLARAKVGNVESQIEGVGDCAYEVCRYWKRRESDLRNTYVDQRTRQAYSALASACMEENIDLNALLQYPQASKSRLIPKWVKKACELTAQANEVEILVADMRGVSSLAEEIKALDVKIRAGGMSDDEQLEVLKLRELKYDELLDMTKEMPDREVALAEASRILNSNTTFRTETGKRQGLTPEQEEAMMVRGKAIIAAGAGSGKTRVLASKIAYLVNELGVNPSQIIATSFSKASADELQERALKYDTGDSVSQGKYIGKTTHSIANAICRRLGTFNNMTGPLSDSQNASWVEAAIKQVSMVGSGEKPTPTPFIKGKPALSTRGQTLSAPEPSPAPQQEQNPFTSEEDMQTMYLLSRVVKTIAEKALWAQTQPWGRNPNSWSHTDFNNMVPAIDDVSPDRKYVRLKPPTDPIWRDPGFRSLVNQMISGSPRGADSVQRSNPFPGFQRFASYPSKRDMETSLGQWFNLGVEPNQVLTDDVSEIDYEKYIGQQYANLISPTEAFAEASDESGKIFAAVYGAYMYFKGEHKLYTFDDQILQGIKGLAENPNILAQHQNTYKHILVDEAQDLNRGQHVFFGMIAGHIDPVSLEPYGDGRMTADTYCFIGDDKQAIYEFRGADPKRFVENSDQVERPDSSRGEFKTSILRTNFRSGANIVKAANKLMEHNKDKIPMVCNANPDKAEGDIYSREYSEDVEGLSPGAEEVAKEMKGLLESEGWGSERKFGIGCRTNKELKGYALHLLLAGVPYQSKNDLLGTKSISGPKALMAFASSNPAHQAEAVYEGHRHAVFFLNSSFNDVLRRVSQGQNPMQFLLNGGANSVQWSGDSRANSRMKRAVNNYVDYIREVQRIGSENPVELLDAILYDLRDAKGETFADKAKEMLSEAEKEDLASENEGLGDSGEDMSTKIEEYLGASFQILRLIFETRTLEEGLDFFQNLAQISASSVISKDNPATKQAVFLGTCHAWKGLECENMYVPMTAKTFPHAKSEGDKEAMASERRLAYVALTRGQDRVVTLSGGKGLSQFIGEACIMSEKDLQQRAMGNAEVEDTSATAGLTRTAFNQKLSAYLDSQVDLEEDFIVDDL
jgi:superfamily I DNA/RNA helicase